MIHGSSGEYQPRLVVVTGLLGSGKTTLSRTLSEDFDYDYLGIGDELARIYRLQNNLADDQPVSGLARMPIHRMIRMHDPDYFARLCIAGDYEKRVVDGLRNQYDAERITSAGGMIVSLVAPRPVRFARRLGSGEAAKDGSIYDLVSREMAELDGDDRDGAQVLRVMALAVTDGFFIDASGTRKDTINQFIEGVGKSGL